MADDDDEEYTEADRQEDEKRRKQRNTGQLADQEMQVWSMFLAASMAGGVSAKKSVREADDALAALKQRFT